MDIQIKGGKHDSIEHIKLDKYDPNYFDLVKASFFNINQWKILFNGATHFQVTDEYGIEKYDKIKAGDLVKIKISGLENRIGYGYDWVIISDLKVHQNDNFEKISFVLSPYALPDSPEKTAHFFEACAKNYFSITKSALKITAEVHGRNEIPNYKNLSLVDKARNCLVANGGIFGLSKIHWNLWTKNILDKEYLNKF